MTRFLALLPFAVLTTATLAQTDPCLSRVHTYEAAPALLPGDTLHLRTPAGAALLYLGAEHTSDPAHPFIARLDAHFSAFAPTIVFFEGPDRGVQDSRDETIQLLGESGYSRFLAQKAGVPTARIEPVPKDEFFFVADTLGPDRAALFFVLREAARLRDRRGVTGDALRGAVASLLQQAAPLGLPLATLDDLDTRYRHLVSADGDWMDVPGAWFDPLSFDPAAHFFPAANRASSHFRNLYMAQTLARAVQEGHRVLAVVGRNHLPMQADALRCLLDSETP